MNPLRIVFAGTPEFTLPSLQAIADTKHQLLAVFTQPDRPAGRGQKLQPSAVKTWAMAHHLPVYQPLNFKQDEAVAALEALEPDILVVIAYGLILPPKVLTIPRLGCINVHASLLPFWRGASPIQHAILHGDHQTGVTIMQMNSGMDTGDILEQRTCLVDIKDTASTLHDRLASLAVEPLLTTLEALALGQARAKVQDNELATYTGKIEKEDALINWHQTAIEIDRQIRAFNPWPIAFTQLGDERLRIHRAHVVQRSHQALPGTILALDKQGMLVAAAEHAIMVEMIQFPGAKVMTVANWLNAGRRQLHLNLVFR